MKRLALNPVTILVVNDNVKPYARWRTGATLKICTNLIKQVDDILTYHVSRKICQPKVNGYRVVTKNNLIHHQTTS